VGKVEIALLLRDFQAEWESLAFGLFRGASFSTALLPTNCAKDPRFLVSLESAIITALNKRPVVLDCRVTSFADIQLNDNVDDFRLC
jgi:hypothetical protein